MDKQFSDAYDFMQKTLNENENKSAAIPTEEEFHKYYAAFEAGHEVVNYIYRNFMVGDDEEWQTEGPENTLAPDVVKSLQTEVPDIAEEVVKLINAFYDGEELREEILTLVSPHISNPELAETNFEIWYAIYFAVHDDDNKKNYEEFVVEFEKYWA